MNKTKKSEHAIRPLFTAFEAAIKVADSAVEFKLKAAWRLHGGKVCEDASVSTTHLVLERYDSVFTDAECVMVTPQWVFESIRRSHLLCETDFVPESLPGTESDVDILEEAPRVGFILRMKGELNVR